MKILLSTLCLWFAVHLSALASDRVTVTNHLSHIVERGKSGAILRSTKARRDFKRLSGYSHGRPGYQIDHTIPLKRGGPDCPCNMQWLTIDAKKQKDRIE